MITSASNPKVKLVRALQSQRRARDAEQLFVIEGVRLAREAVRAAVPPRLILHTDRLDPRGRSALNQLARLGGEVETVSPAVMAALSATETPPGLLAVLPLPSAFLHPPTSLSFVLVLDRISDPGNLGTLLRTADAAGMDAAFLAPGTVDACNPKVVRAAAGAHFHLPLAEASWEELVERLAGLEVWLAEAGQGLAYDQVDWQRPCALVIGSEAEGTSEAARQWTTRRVHIPMPGKAESLNAAMAAAVIVFEAVRQRRAQRAG